MEGKGRFSIGKGDKKSTKKSLQELKEEGQEQIDGDDIQGGWLQFGGTNLPKDEDDPGLLKKK